MKKKKKQVPKPIFKSHYKRTNFLKWVVSHFPENYREMTYVEPFSGSLGAILCKDKSHIELFGGTDSSTLNIYRSLRNEPSKFLKKICRYRFCEETFLKVKKKCCEPNKDCYLESSLEEYLLRNMSKSEMKTSFSKVNSNSWKVSIKNLPEFSSRIKEVFIVENEPLTIIKDFNFRDTFLFCDPPHLYETKRGKTVYQSDMPVNDHISLSHMLNSFKGKVILSGVSSPLYSRMYKSWNIFKSKHKNKDGKIEVIWKNF
jgi:DNA adenine methylase